MGKTKDHFKKIRDTKGTFHRKMGTIKDRNGMDLTGAEDKRWQEYTEEQYEKGLNDPDNHLAFLHFFSLGINKVMMLKLNCCLAGSYKNNDLKY